MPTLAVGMPLNLGETLHGQTSLARAPRAQKCAAATGRLDDECRNLLRASMDEMGLLARARDTILRVAHTIADLDQSETVQPTHRNEAINYRMLDQQLWT